MDNIDILKNRIQNIIDDMKDNFQYDKTIQFDLIVKPFDYIESFSKLEGLDPDLSHVASAHCFRESYNGPIIRFVMIFNFDFLYSASDDVLIGIIAHELNHLELMSIIKNYTDVFDRNGKFGIYPFEMINDLFCLSKGYGRELMACRRFIESKAQELGFDRRTEYEINSFYLCDGIDLHDIERICSLNGIDIENIDG